MASVADMLKLNRVQLQRLINAGGVKKMTAAYEAARADLEKRLASLKAAGKGTTFTAHHLQAVLVQVRAGLIEFSKQMSGVMTSHTRVVAELANKHTVRSISALEKRFSGHAPPLAVEQAAVFQKVYKSVQPALLNRYKQSEQFYTKPVVIKIRETLTQAILSSANVEETIDMVAGTSGVFDQQKWRAERIVRTELAHAYGTVQQRTMEETAHEIPGLKKKLIETMDNRTGDDSKELHGQIQPVDQPFVWVVKNSKGVPTGKVVKYMNPPNRPNDRATVIPWKDSWAETSVTSPL